MVYPSILMMTNHHYTQNRYNSVRMYAFEVGVTCVCMCVCVCARVTDEGCMLVWYLLTRKSLHGRWFLLCTQ